MQPFLSIAFPLKNFQSASPNYWFATSMAIRHMVSQFYFAFSSCFWIKVHNINSLNFFSLVGFNPLKVPKSSTVKKRVEDYWLPDMYI